MSHTGAGGWELEVVRGREVGRVFPLGSGAIVLGNALNGEPGIDLGPQETASPRRMAGRQARIEPSAEGLTIRDLDSPGGTFVNRQRLLPGQVRRLEAGDVIQLGAVQLKLAPAAGLATAPPRFSAAPPTPHAAATTVRPGSLATPFVAVGSGSTCRSWDDFLTLSAKSWTELRQEMESGRLAAFLKSAGRDDLITPLQTSRPPDERLDEWLGRLPTTRPSLPDLDVHPSVVRLRALAGGGETRSKVVITNTGYRLLRSTLRLEPPETDWVRIPGPFSGGEFTVAESVTIPLDIAYPATLAGPRLAVLVFESNGGSRRVEVRVDPPAHPEALPGIEPDAPQPGPNLRDLLARLPGGLRALIGFMSLLGLRGLMVLGNLVADAFHLDDGSRPSLAGAALTLAAVGATAAARIAWRRGETRDVPSAAFAGAFVGVLLASLVVAACRAVGAWGTGSETAGVVFWAVVGVTAGVGSLWLVPYQAAKGESS